MNDSLPWYKQPLVWMLVAIPCSAVVMGIVMIHLAVSTEDGLVVDDYYKYGKQINRVLRRDHAARAMGVSGVLSVAPDRGVVRLTMNSTPRGQPARLKLRLLHATRRGFDQILVLSRTADGPYGGKLDKPMAPGNWNVELGNETWRITGRMNIPRQQSVRLMPLI